MVFILLILDSNYFSMASLNGESLEIVNPNASATYHRS